MGPTGRLELEVPYEECRARLDRQKHRASRRSRLGINGRGDLVCSSIDRLRNRQDRHRRIDGVQQISQETVVHADDSSVAIDVDLELSVVERQAVNRLAQVDAARTRGWIGRGAPKLEFIDVFGREAHQLAVGRDVLSGHLEWRA